jgi:cell division septum initiation protein DivIVA
MTDSWVKGRVKGLLGAVPSDNGESAESNVHSEPPSDVDAQRQALQVLTLAQRTAEEHVASAHRQADKILAEAEAGAEQIVRQAQANARDLGREAESSLAEARATAAQIVRDAQAKADTSRRNAEKMLSDARARADKIAKDAQMNADEMKRAAEQRYQDVVGTLADKREALQDQIEALEQFDREYRARLTAFMQSQLRALWVDQPHVDPEADHSAAVPAQAGPGQNGR